MITIPSIISPFQGLPGCLAGVFLLAGTAVRAEVASTQTIQLQEGWNAVNLRVAPAAKIAEVFAGTPVEVVSAWYPVKQKVASLQDPAAEPWKSPEWRTWQAGGRPGAFLNNLHGLESGRSYLIKASRAAQVQVSGAVAADRLTWLSQSFNLVGLPADPAAPATLDSFFAASPAHQPLRAFKLVAGKWQAALGSAAIDPAAAYWVWCGQGSEFQGPLDVRISANPVISSAEGSVTLGLLSASASSLPVQVTAAGRLPLSGLLRGSDDTAAALTGAPVTFSATPAQPGQYRIAWAAGSAPAVGASSLLELRAAGVRLVVPVRGRE